MYNLVTLQQKNKSVNTLNLAPVQDTPSPAVFGYLRVFVSFYVHYKSFRDDGRFYM